MALIIAENGPGAVNLLFSAGYGRQINRNLFA
jgi:hypothetical protein